MVVDEGFLNSHVMDMQRIVERVARAAEAIVGCAPEFTRHDTIIRVIVELNVAEANGWHLRQHHPIFEARL